MNMSCTPSIENAEINEILEITPLLDTSQNIQFFFLWSWEA